MLHTHPVPLPAPPAIAEAARRAARAVPPAWPLASAVSVNPFLGQAGEDLAQAGARLARVAGCAVTMPRAWYRERIADGRIAGRDLQEALAAAPPCLRPPGLAALREAIARDAPPPTPLPTIAELAAEVSGQDWPGLVAERIGAWAAGYFDEGQAAWPAPREGGAYAAWRAMAMHDRTPEIAGLPGFAGHVRAAPDSAEAAIARAAQRLALGEAALETCFHRLLASLGGWAQFARYRLWRAELAGGTDATLIDLLAVRLVWEEALFLRHQARIASRWAEVRARHAAPVAPTPDLVVDAILQDAAERAAQRALAQTLAAPAAPGTPQGRPALQAAFCIDVRSEVFRRALESLDPGIRTHGVAGFFGLATAHRRGGFGVEEPRHPALLAPALRSCDAMDPAPGARAGAVRRAWGGFRQAAVSAFAFVEAAGPLHAARLAADALGLSAAPPPAGPAPRLHPAPGVAARVEAAAAALRAMSCTGGFARLVLLVGHGAAVANTPHAAGLQCGACGGHSGEVNARLLASLLNDPQVRAGLEPSGIAIPADTLFVAALHDTTADRVRLYAADHASPAHRDDLARAEAWLAAAGRIARAERAGRLPGATRGSALLRRGRDWAQTRPEWGLAGCAAFIAAPRARTAGRCLGGRAFLHDYDWRQDSGFAVLDLILSAPAVVAGWISLHAYGATVAPAVFGSGSKLLHNVTGGIGVVEGNGGTLRAGLPWQSVHDGTRHAHEPLRLSVCVEAPREAITAVLARREALRALFDNGWLHLFALDGAGRMAWRYAGGLGWTAMDAADAAQAAA